jgi:hypothetical protein
VVPVIANQAVERDADNHQQYQHTNDIYEKDQAVQFAETLRILCRLGKKEQRQNP